jgi:hypothetical protein
VSVATEIDLVDVPSSVAVPSVTDAVSDAVRSAVMDVDSDGRHADVVGVTDPTVFVPERVNVASSDEVTEDVPICEAEVLGVLLWFFLKVTERVSLIVWSAVSEAVHEGV